MNGRAGCGDHRTMKALAPLLFGLATAATAHADDTLPMSVHGSIDAPALRARIAGELRRPVMLVDECAAPCLEIAIARTTASVAYQPANGDARVRVVDLGGDRTQWPLVITLLAGNVVRDEAADLLAKLPAPPPPPQPEPAPAPDPVPAPAPKVVVEVTPGPAPKVVAVVESASLPDPLQQVERERMSLAFGFVPGLSTDWTHVGRVEHAVSVDLIAGVSGGSSLLTLSGIADIERGDVSGLQVAGVTAVAHRVSGIQLAGIAAVAGDLTGVQIAGTAAVADRMDGLQVGGIATVARGGTSSQLAGIATVARDANLQVAGIVNVARRLRGVQVAPINVASRVDGVQIGLINVGGSADGFSFGLINIVPGGRADLESTIDTARVGTLLFRHCGKRLHNV